MDDNVYAPAGEHGRASEWNSEPYVWTDKLFGDIFGLLGRGWQLALNNIGTVGVGIAILFGIAVLVQVLAFAASMVGATMGGTEGEIAGQLANSAVSMCGGFVQLFFQLGLMKLVVELDRGNEAELDVLWSQGSGFIQALAVTVVLIIAYILVFGVAGGIIGGVGFGAVSALGMETGLMVAVLVGGLLGTILLVGLIIVGLGLSMMMYGIVDERAPWLDALSFSWNLTTGWKLFLFLQGIVLALLYICVACVTLCMGTPVAGGVIACVQAVTYNALLSDADANERFLG